MKAFAASLRGLARGAARDGTLYWLLPAPVLCAAALRFLLPLAEGFLTSYFRADAILAPYYPVFDLFLAAAPPLLFSYLSVMVVLEERDEGLSRYLAVSPLGRRGYLLTRLAVPALAGGLFDLPLLPLFSLTAHTFPMVLALTLGGTLCGLISALLVPAFAGNKVEGMALLKLSGLLLLGLPLPYFLQGPARLGAGLLPSFWMGELSRSGAYLCLLPLLAVSAAWILLLYGRFSKKLL